MRYPARIVRGRGEGKRIGFPTLNFEIPEALDAPPGIYAGFVHVGGKSHPAVFHFGDIPTFGIKEASLEAHLLQGLTEAPEMAEVELTGFIRKIEAFPSLEELKTAIAADVLEAKKMLNVL